MISAYFPHLLILLYVYGRPILKLMCGLLKPAWVPCKAISMLILELSSFRMINKFQLIPITVQCINGKSLKMVYGHLNLQLKAISVRSLIWIGTNMKVVCLVALRTKPPVSFPNTVKIKVGSSSVVPKFTVMT